MTHRSIAALEVKSSISAPTGFLTRGWSLLGSSTERSSANAKVRFPQLNRSGHVTERREWGNPSHSLIARVAAGLAPIPAPDRQAEVLDGVVVLVLAAGLRAPNQRTRNRPKTTIDREKPHTSLKEDR